MDRVVCDGVPVPVEQGTIRVQLTEDNPALECTFINELDEARALRETGPAARRRRTARTSP